MKLTQDESLNKPSTFLTTTLNPCRVICHPATYEEEKKRVEETKKRVQQYLDLGVQWTRVPKQLKLVSGEIY